MLGNRLVLAGCARSMRLFGSVLEAIRTPEVGGLG